MTRASLLWCAGAATLLALGGHGLDVQWRDAALARFLSNENGGIERIVDAYGVDPGACPPMRGADLHSLALAFVTVESFATPYVEGRLRTLIVRIGALTGHMPDISAGLGRIRPSTARAALSGAQAAPTASLPDAAIAQELMTACGSARVAAEILHDIARLNGKPTATVDRDFVRLAAASYNGQANNAASSEAALSARIYFELVYALYQHYRFKTLASHR